MTEIEFEQAVVDLAHTFGWRVAGFRPARTQHGWRTPVKYDGKGWPDLTMVHPSGRIIFAELKTDRGALSAEQAEWADTFVAAIAADRRALGVPSMVEYHVWRPRDGDHIADRLSFGRVHTWTP